MKPWRKYSNVYLWHMGKCTHWRWNPEETSKPCTSERRESTLTGEWNHDEAAKHAPLTHGIANSLVNETLKKPVNHAPVKHVNVHSLLNETLRKPLTWLNQWNTHIWHTEKWIPWWMKPWWNSQLCTSETCESALTVEKNCKVNIKPCTSDTPKWTHCWMKP